MLPPIRFLPTSPPPVSRTPPASAASPGTAKESGTLPNDELRTANREPRTIGVLISGRGSNLQALIDAVGDGTLDARVALVISNKANVAGLDRARTAGIDTLVLDHRAFASRDEYDAEIARELL